MSCLSIMVSVLYIRSYVLWTCMYKSPYNYNNTITQFYAQMNTPLTTKPYYQLTCTHYYKCLGYSCYKYIKNLINCSRLQTNRLCIDSRAAATVPVRGRLGGSGSQHSVIRLQQSSSNSVNLSGLLPAFNFLIISLIMLEHCWCLQCCTQI